MFITLLVIIDDKKSSGRCGWVSRKIWCFQRLRSAPVRNYPTNENVVVVNLFQDMSFCFILRRDTDPFVGSAEGRVSHRSDRRRICSHSTSSIIGHSVSSRPCRAAGWKWNVIVITVRFTAAPLGANLRGVREKC